MIFLQPDDIFDVVRSIWTTVLGIDVAPRGPLEMPSGNEGFLTGCVQITGACKGGVLLICSVGLAKRAASTVFGVDEAELTKDLLHDVVGELTNMVAGNLKALLMGQCFLCLPVIADGANYVLSVRNSQPVNELAFEADGHTFALTILEFLSGPTPEQMRTSRESMVV